VTVGVVVLKIEIAQVKPSHEPNLNSNKVQVRSTSFFSLCLQLE